jgi:hypothetical protein
MHTAMLTMKFLQQLQALHNKVNKWEDFLRTQH